MYISRIKIHSSFVLITIIFLIIGPINGSNTGKLHGTLQDSETGGPIIAANVIVKETTLGTITNEAGQFVVLNIPPGTYSVVFSHIAYHSLTVNKVRISSDYSKEISVKLTPSVVEGEGVTVVAQRSMYQGDFTATRSILSEDEIEMIPAENIADLMKMHAGMVLGSDGLFHLRGGRGSEIRYYVDGIDVTDPYSSELSSVMVNTSAIQEMSVVSGTYNAEYGQALSGIVNLVTKNGNPKKTNGELAIYSGNYLSRSPIFSNINEPVGLSLTNSEGSVSGPVPFTGQKVSYFLSGKISSSDGWLYGQRIFLPTDSSDFSPLDPEEWHVEATGDSSFIPMNPSTSMNFMSKISTSLGQRTKLSLSYLQNNYKFQNYNHLFKYNPDGNYRQFRHGRSITASLSHSFSNRAFTNFRVSSVSGKYRYYVFEDLSDERYVSQDRFNIIAYNFYTGGTGMWHFQEGSSSLATQWDFTTQIGDRHLIKTGLGGTLRNLSLKEFELLLDESTNWDPQIPLSYSPRHNQYDHSPSEFYGFVQDKIEFMGLVLNLGIRFDHFSPDGKYPSDLRDPKNSSQIVVGPTSQISPRFGMAYPITDQGILYVSYGHFFQIPPYKFLYINPEFEVEPGVLTSIIGNAALKPQKSVAYEIGVQQQLTNFFSVILTTYNKDITNLIGSDYHQLYDISRKYTRYINRDYGNVRGSSFVLKGVLGKNPLITLNTGYTYQLAQGNASDPNAVYYDLRSSPPRESEKTLVFLDWDERHTITSSIFLSKGDKWSIGFTFNLGSGMPYTPEYQSQRTSFENSGRKPFHYNIDGQFSHQIAWGNHIILFFLKVYNITDRQNELLVFPDTGRSGYSLIPQYVPNNRYFDLADYLNRPDYFSEPRKILVGIKMQL